MRSSGRPHRRRATAVVALSLAALGSCSGSAADDTSTAPPASIPPPSPSPAPGQTAAATTAAATTATATAATTTPGEAPGSVDVAWVATMSGRSDDDEIDGLAIGPDGSVYVTGQFVGSTVLAGVELVSNGGADIPLARFGPDGDLVWATSFGGAGRDDLFDLDVDEEGVVATGWIEGAVRFGDLVVESAGDTDCVVAAFDHDGTARWAATFGGAGPDGCDEVTIAADGSIVTSIDTAGGWSVGGVDLPASSDRDTVLLRLDRDGTVGWARAVGGRGAQRGKAIAIGDDGTIAFGGDASGELVVGDEVVDLPGARRDAWVSSWTPAGALRWVRAWGGPGDDLSKGLVVGAGGRTLSVSPFESTMRVGPLDLTSLGGVDLAVVALDPGGELAWATTVGSPVDLPGGEAVLGARGGIVLPGTPVDGLVVTSADGEVAEVAGAGSGTAWIVEFDEDGAVHAASAIAGTVDVNPSELDRDGDRLVLDVVLRGGENDVGGGDPFVADRKDASLWSLTWP